MSRNILYFSFFLASALSAADQTGPCLNRVATDASVHAFSSLSKCYNVVLEKTSWQTAHTRCRDAKGILVTIHDNWTQTWLTTRLRKIGEVSKWDFWIGLYPLNNQQSNDYLTWIDDGECSGGLTEEQKIDCEPYIGPDHCQKQSKCCFKSAGTPDGIPWCFYPSTNKGPLPYSAWAPNQPDRKSATDCVLLWRSGNWTWDDQDCSNAHDYNDIGYICQFDLPTTVAPTETTAQSATTQATTQRPETTVVPTQPRTSGATHPSETPSDITSSDLTPGATNPSETQSDTTSSDLTPGATNPSETQSDTTSSDLTSSTTTSSDLTSGATEPSATTFPSGQTSDATYPSQIPGDTTPSGTPSQTSSSRTEHRTTNSETTVIGPIGTSSERAPNETTRPTSLTETTVKGSNLSTNSNLATSDTPNTLQTKTTTIPSQTPSRRSTEVSSTPSLTEPSSTSSEPLLTTRANENDTTPNNGTGDGNGQAQTQGLSEGGLIGIIVLVVFLIVVAVLAISYAIHKRMVQKKNEESMRLDNYTEINNTIEASEGIENSGLETDA